MQLDMVGYRDASPVTPILDRLYLGGFLNAQDLATANPHGITGVLNCTTEPLFLPRAVTLGDRSGFQVLQLDQLDETPWSPGAVFDGLEWLHTQLRNGRTVLVHCHAGISRSPSLVAAYLYTCGWNFWSALDEIVRRRPQVRPAPVLVASLVRFFGIGQAA